MILLEKIKIVFILHKLLCGGAEQALYDLLCLMDKTKFDITIVTTVDGGEWEDKFKNLGFPVFNIFYKRQKKDPVSFLKHQLRKLWVEWILRWNPRRFLSYILPEDVDITVSYSIWKYEDIALAYNTKHVKFIHANIKSNEGFRRSTMKIAHLLPAFHRIICVSDESFIAFKQVTGLQDNVEMHFNPLNSENVCRMAEAPLDISGEIPYICAVGRLAPEKGYDRLIRIHRRLLDEGLMHRLVIVGDGPEKEKLQQTIRETETEESVILTGYQANPYPYMKNSRFLVCSSFTEGLPVIAMEALTLGVTIVSAVPSIGEVFGEECCGIITENDDGSLEHGIRKMLEDTVFYETAKHGAEKRSAFFDGNRMVKEIENVFFELMEGK